MYAPRGRDCFDMWRQQRALPGIDQQRTLQAYKRWGALCANHGRPGPVAPFQREVAANHVVAASVALIQWG